MANQKFPEPTVGALILNPEGKILLIQSKKWRDAYTIPGGHIELGETMEAALRREVKEETNLDIHSIELVDFQEFIFDEAFWEPAHFIFFDYACRTDSTDVHLNDEGQAYRWVSSEGIANLPVDSYTLRSIQTYLNRHKR